jgi:hypothetical protein
MKKVLWLLPVTFIVGLRFLFPAMAAASSPIRDGGSSLGLSFAPEGGAGIDVIWIAMGSVVGLILILVVVTFIVLPKIKGGQAAKLGAKQAGNSRAIQGKGAPTPQSNSMPMARDAQQKQTVSPAGNLPGRGMPQQGMPAQPRPMQPQAMQGQPAGGFPQPQPVQPRPMQPQAMQGQPAGGFPQPQPVQPRPMQPQAMQGQPAGGFPQPQPVQPRPMQPQAMQGQPAGGFPQPQPVQPRPMQPMPQGIPVPPKPVQVQHYQPVAQSRPVYPVASQVPIQSRPVQPVSPMSPGFPQVPQQFSGMPVQGAPLFRVGNLVITPSQVKEDDPVSISATVFNQGSNAGQYKLVLRVNSMVEGISELTVNPGMSQIATFSVAKSLPGSYFVEADNLKGTFTVMPRSAASYTISNLTVNPEKVNQGDPVAISFIVTNSGDSTGNYTAVVKIKGIDEIVEDIPIGPNCSQRVTFNVIKEAAGFYPISIEDLTERFVVEMDWKL